LEEEKTKTRIFVTIKLTLKEQFVTKEKSSISLPKIVIENAEKPQIKLLNDQTNRFATGLIFRESKKSPFNIIPFKLNFQKIGTDMISYLPSFEEAIEIFVDWEQPVQLHYAFNHPGLPYSIPMSLRIANFPPPVSTAELISPPTIPNVVPLTSLETSLMAFSSCPDCDDETKEAEAKKIQEVLLDQKANNPDYGCINSSHNLILALATNIPGSTYSEGTVSGSSVFWFSATRTWIKVTTKCFVFELVATWYGFFRHQAVQVKSLWPGANDTTIVLDTYDMFDSSQSLSDWAGGEGELEDTGPVSAGF